MKIKKNLWVILLAVAIILLMILSLTNIIKDTLGMSLAFALFIAFSLIIAKYAKKNDVKLIEYLMVFFAFITTIFLFFTIKAYFKTKGLNKYKFQIVVNEKVNEKTLMFEYDNHNYYMYNLDKVDVIIDKTGKKLSLEDALKNKEITLKEILNLAIPNDGTAGYKIYYDGGQNKYKNDEYSIIVCENDTNDIIFSTFKYTYDDICNK